MAFSVASGTFITDASTGNHSVTGVGFTPKALIFFGMSNQTSGFSTQGILEAGISFVSAATQYQRNINQNDNQSTPVTSATSGTTKVFQYQQPSNGDDAIATLTSMDVDGFTLNFTTNTATINIHWIALGGTDLSVKVGTATSNASVGTLVVTGVGFVPTAVLLAQGQNGTGLGLGAATSTTQRWVDCFTSLANNPTVAKTRQRTNQVVAVSNGTTDTLSADFTSFDADGFTLTESVDAGTTTIGYLAMRGVNMKAGSFTKATATGNFSVTGFGFAPQIVLLVSWGKVASTSQQADGVLAMGCGISTSMRQTLCHTMKDAVAASSQVDTYSNNSKFFSIASAGNPATLVDLADLVSLDADGFTGNLSTASGTASEILYFAMGNIVVPTVTTTAITAITTITASSGGNVTSDGGSAVTARGVCWSTSANPTIVDSITSDGTGTGVFSSSITGLLPATTYHVRAYATNVVGTGYGADVSFTTLGLRGSLMMLGMGQ